MEMLFIDAVPENPAKLPTIHGCENGNCVSFVFVLLPSKTEICYDQMWDMLHYMCRERGLVFSPETVHIDFEKDMHNSVRRNFRQANISCCRFHLGQCIWRKIQTIGFSAKYRDKDSEIGKWLTLFYGLPYLDAEEIEDCFFMDIMSSAQDDAKCHQFADYMLENYVSSDARYPLSFGQIFHKKEVNEQQTDRKHSTRTSMDNCIPPTPVSLPSLM